MEEPPAFVAIARRWAMPDAPGVIERFEVSLPAALAAGDDHLHVLSYLRGLGFEVRTLEDIAAALLSIEDEEELSAEWAREGLVIHHASDGWLTLFTR